MPLTAFAAEVPLIPTMLEQSRSSPDVQCTEKLTSSSADIGIEMFRTSLYRLAAAEIL